MAEKPSCPFIDQLLNDLLHILVLQGYSPRAVRAALVDRIKEYGQYKKWGPEEGKGFGGTLLYEAGKHILEPVGCIGPWYGTSFTRLFLGLLPAAFVWSFSPGVLTG